MNELWKKDPEAPDLYVDIFKPSDDNDDSLILYFTWFRMQSLDAPIRKDDEISLQKKKDGNKLFGDGEWCAAMEKYNECLCYAEYGSTNISLAYANRSSCFFKMGMFNECLVDIELAKKFGYPAEKMSKLDNRKAECLKCIEGGGRVDEFASKLSFAPDEKFPCIADVVKFEQGADGEYSAFAKEDIDVGQTIAIEKAFTSYLYSNYGRRCSICLKGNTNLEPCTECSVAMFCSTECQCHHLHDQECGWQYSKKIQLNGLVMDKVRTLLKVIKMFSTPDELMAFVEETIAADQKELPDTLSDEKSKYRAFLKLPIGQVSAEVDDGILTLSYSVFEMLLDIKPNRKKFKSEKRQRFLMHLIMMHFRIWNHNATRVGCDRIDLARHLVLSRLGLIQRDANDSDRPQNIIYTQIGLVQRYFKHSCVPNVWLLCRNGSNVFVTIRPVKKGDPLVQFQCETLLMARDERQKHLLELKNLICKCGRCEGNEATPDERKQVKSYPGYREIKSCTPRDCNDSEKRRAVAEKCVGLLQQHGHINWCEEIGNVLITYASILQHQIMGKETIRTDLLTFDSESNPADIF